MSTHAPSLDHARLIAGTELTRRWRSVTGKNPLQIVALAVALLFMMVFLVAATFLAYGIGGEFRAGPPADVTATAGSAVAAAWLVVLFIVSLRTYANGTAIDAADGLLTTVPYRDVVVGLLLTESASVFAVAVPAALGIAGAFAAGAGSAVTFLSVAGALLLTVTTALVAGFLLAFVVKNLAVRSSFVANHKLALGAVLFVGYMAVVLSQSVGTFFQPVVSVLARSPLAWYADLGLFFVVGDASVLFATIAAVGTIPFVVVLLALVTRLAGSLWYADPAQPEQDGQSVTKRRVTARRLDGHLDRPTTWIAHKSWLRARRSPIKLVYVAYPAFLLYGPISISVETGTVGPTVPVLIALYGAWATGALFTLNPLGDEGAVLPVTLTTAVDGTSFMRGLVLVGVAVGTPVTALATLGTAMLSPLSAVETILLTVVSVVLCVSAAAMATGAGTLFPRFEAANVTRSRKAVVPSLLAFTVYSFVLSLVGVPGLLVGVPTLVELVGDLSGLSSTVIVGIGTGTTASVAALGGWAAFRYAAASFDRYTM